MPGEQDPYDQQAAWKLLLSLNGLDTLPKVTLYFKDQSEVEGLLAGCAEPRPSPHNRVFVKVQETEVRERISDCAADPRCQGFSFLAVTRVKVIS